jgi:hypothetical protein
MLPRTRADARRVDTHGIAAVMAAVVTTARSTVLAIDLAQFTDR